MAGGKTAAKKKKPPAADSPELKRVQAWVADGLKARDLNDLLKHVGQASQEPPQGVQLLGSLYLLLKKWPAGKDAVPSQLLQLMHQLAFKAANDHDAATALVQKPSIVLVWAAVQGLLKVAGAADGAKQQQAYERIAKLLKPSLKQSADPQRWLDQWQGPQDFPGSAEQDYPVAKSQAQLATVLGSEVVSGFLHAAIKADPDKGFDQDMKKAGFSLKKSLDELAVSSASGPVQELMQWVYLYLGQSAFLHIAIMLVPLEVPLHSRIMAERLKSLRSTRDVRPLIQHWSQGCPCFACCLLSRV
jgi:hypothetical protein